MKFVLKIEGAKEFEENLKTLGDRVAKKVVRKGVREGLRPMLAAEKNNALSMVGGRMGRQIAGALQIRAPKRQKRGAYTLNVQLKSGIEEFVHTAKSGKKFYIPAAIEYGHLTGDTYVPGIPFGRSAAEATGAEVFRRYGDELRKGLLREAMIARSK